MQIERKNQHRPAITDRPISHFFALARYFYEIIKEIDSMNHHNRDGNEIQVLTTQDE